MKRTATITKRPRMDEKVQVRRGETLDRALDRFAATRGLTVKEDLARLADGAPQHWHTPKRAQLLADGLIEIVIGEDGLWRGDRLTDKGRAELGETAP